MKSPPLKTIGNVKSKKRLLKPHELVILATRRAVRKFPHLAIQYELQEDNTELFFLVAAPDRYVKFVLEISMLGRPYAQILSTFTTLDNKLKEDPI